MSRHSAGPSRRRARHRRVRRPLFGKWLQVLPTACLAVAALVGSPLAMGNQRGVLTAPDVRLAARVDPRPAVHSDAALSFAVWRPRASSTALTAASPAAAPVSRPRSASVIGLGDSVPAGAGCSCDNFVTLLAQPGADDVRWTARNAAQSGLTSQGLLSQLDEDDVAGWTQHADAAVVTIGANDFDSMLVGAGECSPANGLRCYRGGLRGLRSNLTQILARLSKLHRGGSRVLVTGYWNVFLDGRVGRAQGKAYVAAADALTRQVNAVIKTVAEANGARYVDLYAAFKAGGDDTALLAPDGDHPSASGHRLIARVVRRELAAGRSL